MGYKIKSRFSSTPNAPGWSTSYADEYYLGPIGETMYTSYTGDVIDTRMDVVSDDHKFPGGVVISASIAGRGASADLSLEQVEDLAKKLVAHIKWVKSRKPVQRGVAEGQ